MCPAAVFVGEEAPKLVTGERLVFDACSEGGGEEEPSREQQGREWRPFCSMEDLRRGDGRRGEGVSRHHPPSTTPLYKSLEVAAWAGPGWRRQTEAGPGEHAIP
jgi:hypothetical protein